jgi:D-glycero-D-manno-heptose 1,7-bisphosphate phosphatase
MKTVFLDRDGVVNHKRPENDYVKTWEEFKFLPGVFEALRLLQNANVRLVVVTNQRGIARGLFTESTLQAIHGRMRQALLDVGVTVDGIYYCPHEKNVCECRKPKLGLFWQAQRDYPGLRFDSSFVIGDALCDMEAAAGLGCPAYLVAEGSRRETILHQAQEQGIAIQGVASSLLEVTREHLLPELVVPSRKKG